MISLIIIICALALELFYESVDRYKSYNWFYKYRDWIISLYRDSQTWNGPGGVLAVIAAPFLIVFVIQSIMWVASGLATVFYFLIAIFILVYCLRFHALDYLVAQVELYRGTNSDKEKNVLQKVNELEPEDQQQPEKLSVNGLLLRSVLVQSNQRLFAVLFWFLILGPAGALLYRLSEMLAFSKVGSSLAENEFLADMAASDQSKDNFDNNAAKLFGLLSWIPARLCALGYALAGGFEDAIHNWREIDDDRPEWQQAAGQMQKNHAVLYQAGIGAIQIQRYYFQEVEQQHTSRNLSFDAIKAAQGLIIRTLLIWMVFIVLIALTGWLH